MKKTTYRPYYLSFVLILLVIIISLLSAMIKSETKQILGCCGIIIGISYTIFTLTYFIRFDETYIVFKYMANSINKEACKSYKKHIFNYCDIYSIDINKDEITLFLTEGYFVEFSVRNFIRKKAIINNFSILKEKIINKK